MTNDSIPRLVRIEEGVLHAADSIRLSSLSHARVIQSAEFHEIESQRVRLEQDWRQNRIPVGLRTRQAMDVERRSRERSWNEWPRNPFNRIHSVPLGGVKVDEAASESVLFRGLKGAEEFVIGLEAVRILDDLVAGRTTRGSGVEKAKAQRNR